MHKEYIVTDPSFDPNHVLVEYLRDYENRPVGMLMSVKDTTTNQIRIGWSLVRSNSDDKFNRNLAYNITLGRVELAHIHNITIPFDVYESGKLENFVLRCMKYYRSNNVTVFGKIRKDNDLRNKLEYTEYVYNPSAQSHYEYHD